MCAFQVLWIFGHDLGALQATWIPGMQLAHIQHAHTMQVSLAHWNQDEAWGGFGGPHCMVKGGYSSLMDPIAATLDIRRGVAVSQISYSSQAVKVTSDSGKTPNSVVTLLLVLGLEQTTQSSANKAVNHLFPFLPKCKSCAFSGGKHQGLAS